MKKKSYVVYCIQRKFSIKKNYKNKMMKGHLIYEKTDCFIIEVKMLHIMLWTILHAL